MKKTLMVLGVLAALSMVFVGCDQPTTTEDATGATSSTQTTQAASDTAADDTTATDAGTGAATTTTGSGTQAAGDTSSSAEDTGAAAAEKTPTYVTIFEESKVLGWGDSDGIVIAHDDFETGFTGIRVTFTATGGCFKIAACDPWEELVPTSVEGDGGVAEHDNSGKTVGLAEKENGTVTVSFSSADAAKIIGEGKAGAWGGMKIMGDATITVTKVELVK